MRILNKLKVKTMEEQMNPQEAQPEEKAEKPIEEPAGVDPKDAEENKWWAVLSYLGILFLIPLLAKKDSKFAQFHAKQGLVIAIGELFAWFPVFGWVLGIILFVFSIMGIINVLCGREEKLPVIGDLAEKINL